MERDSVAVLSEPKCVDVLSLDGFLEVRVPFALFRCAFGRMQKGVALRQGESRARWLQGCLYQQVGIHSRRRHPLLVWHKAAHLLKLCPETHVEVFPKMNHGQLLVDRPQEIADRILNMLTN